MNLKRKAVRFILLAITLFISSLFIYPLSIYLAEGTKDPDIYESYGWVTSLLLLVLAIIFGNISLMFFFEWRNQKENDSKIYNF